MMDMILMDKNIPVAELQIDIGFGLILGINKMENPEHLPLLAKYNKDQAAGLRHWLGTRSIPKTRKNLDAILQEAGVETSDALSLKSLGLNLSDQYWFKPKGSTLQWEQINLFTNDFLTQRFATAQHTGSESSYSPDSSSNGELPKFWLIKNEKRLLYKESTAPYYQQAYNEVFASRLLDEMNVVHVNYTLDFMENTMHSVCETFITPDTKYVPALEIRSVCNKTNNENDYQHFMRCMEVLEIPCEKKEIDTMLMFDYLINNSDRHYGNFGFIQNVNTQKFERMAPLFDHGNSLWYKNLTTDMVLREQESKPFRDTHEKQIQLLTKAELPIENLSEEGVRKIAWEVYADNRFMDQERLEKLTHHVWYFAERIKELQLNQTKTKYRKEVDLSR